MRCIHFRLMTFAVSLCASVVFVVCIVRFPWKWNAQKLHRMRNGLWIMSHSIPFGVADFIYLFVRWRCFVSSHRVFLTILISKTILPSVSTDASVMNLKKPSQTRQQKYERLLQTTFRFRSYSLACSSIVFLVLSDLYCEDESSHECVAWRRNLTPNHWMHCLLKWQVTISTGSWTYIVHILTLRTTYEEFERL